MILDSTFLVDLERERHRREFGPAHRFLERHPDESLAITFTVAGELAAGRSLGGDKEAWERHLAPFQLHGFTPEVAWQFGRLYRILQERGTPIGANDLWIAATALVADDTLVTRNAADFARVPGLRVVGY